MDRSRWRLIIALLVAVGGVVTYLGTRSVNPVTGEVQHVSLTPAQEIALGVQSAPQMAAQFGGELADPAIQQYVESVGHSGGPEERRRQVSLPVQVSRPGRPEDAQRLCPARRPDLHHLGSGLQAEQRGAAGRCPRARDLPRGGPSLGGADGQAGSHPVSGRSGGDGHLGLHRDRGAQRDDRPGGHPR